MVFTVQGFGAEIHKGIRGVQDVSDMKGLRTVHLYSRLSSSAVIDFRELRGKGILNT